MICFSIFYVHTTIFFFRSVQDGQTLTHTLLFMLFCFLTDSITSIQDIGCIDFGECKNIFWKFYLTGYRISSSLAGLKCHHKFWPKRAGNCYVGPPYKDHGPYDPFTSLYQYRNTKSLLSYLSYAVLGLLLLFNVLPIDYLGVWSNNVGKLC